MKTKEQIFIEVGINYEKLNKNFPLLYSKIKSAMELYVIEHIKKIKDKMEGGNCIDCSYRDMSILNNPCDMCNNGDLKIKNINL